MANHYMNTYMIAGVRRVIEWDTDVPERYCAGAPDDGDGTGLVINPASNMCNVHWPADEGGATCTVAERTPTTCLHPVDRLDADAPPLTPRCLECGLSGVDVTAQWTPTPRLVEQAPGDTSDPVL